MASASAISGCNNSNYIIYIKKKKPFYLNTHLIENCFQTQLLYTKSLIYLFIFKTFCEVAYLIG